MVRFRGSVWKKKKKDKNKKGGCSLKVSGGRKECGHLRELGKDGEGRRVDSGRATCSIDRQKEGGKGGGEKETDWKEGFSRPKKKVLIRLYDFSPFTSAQQGSSETSDSFSPEPCSEILGTKFVCARGRTAGLPHRQAGQPVANDGKRMGSGGVYDDHGRSSDA